MNRVILISACAGLLLGGCSDADERASAPARHANETGAPRHAAPGPQFTAQQSAESAAEELPNYQDVADETTHKMQSQTEAAASYFEE